MSDGNAFQALGSASCSKLLYTEAEYIRDDEFAEHIWLKPGVITTPDKFCCVATTIDGEHQSTQSSLVQSRLVRVPNRKFLNSPSPSTTTTITTTTVNR